MRETYACPDGRRALLRFDEDALRVTATTTEGRPIGSFQFELVTPDGDTIGLTEDTGGTALLKLAQSELREEWQQQGITERAVSLASDELSVSPVNELLRRP